MDYVMGQPWFVLRSSDIHTEQTIEVDGQVLLLDVCDEDLHCVDMVFRRVAEAMEASGSVEAPLLIAVLPSGQAAPSVAGVVQEEACKKLLAAQKRLHELGVDEVFFRGISAAETHLSVHMALQRLEHKHNMWTAWEADVREEERAGARKMLEERAHEARRQCGEDLWAHFGDISIARVLPPIDASLPTKIVTGEQVGELLLDGVIGRGGFGIVCQAWNMASSKAEAVKIISKQSHSTISGMLSVGAEVEAMRKLKHENVVSVLGVLHSARHILLRMELVGRMTLMGLLSGRGCGLPADHAGELFRQLSAGMAYCHRRGIAHCDIKPENLGVSDDQTCLKILDFGSACDVDAVLTEQVGTMPFMAPEMLLGGGYAPTPADVWAAGVVLVEMMAGVGSLNRLMGWRANAKGSLRAGGELQAVLAKSPHAIRKMASEACGFECAELAALLDAALAAAPKDRASAAELAQIPLRALAPPQEQDKARPPPRPRGRGEQLSSRLRRYAPVAANGDVPAASAAAGASA